MAAPRKHDDLEAILSIVNADDGAVSHSVQMHDRYYEEFEKSGWDKEAAIVGAFAELFVPTLSGILTDAIGILAILLVPIAMLQKLAISASFWILAITVSELLHGVRDESATRALIVQENRRYARRQLIWFRKEPRLRWFDGPGEMPDVIARVAAALSRPDESA